MKKNARKNRWARPSDYEEDHSTVPALQLAIDALWKRATTFANSIGDMKFIDGMNTQHYAVDLIEDHLQQVLWDTSNLYRRTLLTANTAMGAAEWLSIRPTEPLLSMTDDAVQLATRHRLGLLPSGTLLDISCVCDAHTSFAADPDHFHSCSRYRHLTVTQRHNNLMHTLAELARSVGFYCILEPNLHLRPEKPQGSLTTDEDHYNRHADILMIKHNQQLYIDVAVTRPTQASNLGQQLIQMSPLHSTKSIEREKHRKYDDIAKLNHYTMIPFVMESYGGMGKEAEKLLRKLSAHAHEWMEPREFLLYARQRIAVTLQSANANISLLGQQQLHLDRYSLRTHGTPWQYQLAASHRAVTHTGRLAERVAPELGAAQSEWVERRGQAGHSGLHSRTFGAYDEPMVYADVSGAARAVPSRPASCAA